MKEVELLSHQIDFIQSVEPAFLGLVGGYRSGKTHALCHKALYMSLLNTKEDGALLSPTYGMITRTLVPTMNKILYEIGLKFTHNKSDGYYEITFGNKVRRIWLLSAENFDKAAGMTLSWFGIDEIDRMTLQVATDAWKMMVSRLTKGEKKQGFCVSTPEGYNWMYQFFEANADTTRRLIRASTYDNPFIDEDYFIQMAATHTSEQLEAYFYGKFINFTDGNVYYPYDRAKNRSTETLAKHPHAPLSIGIDFNIGKMATIVGIIIGQVPHIVDEIYGTQNTEALIREIKRRYPNRQIKCFVDGSGDTMRSDFTSMSQTDVMQLKQSFGTNNVHHYKGHIPVADRIGAVNQKFANALGQRQLFINDFMCPVLVRCIETQGFINGKPDKSGDIDHMPDALGYFISYVWAPTKHRSKITVLV